jgi:hypothetical protein
VIDFREGAAEIIGYADGSLDCKPDTFLIRSEYRKNYMRGFIHGRIKAGREDAEGEELLTERLAGR